LAWRADSLKRKASTNFGATSSMGLNPFRISMLKSWRFRALANFPNVPLMCEPVLFWLTWICSMLSSSASTRAKPSLWIRSIAFSWSVVRRRSRMRPMTLSPIRVPLGCMRDAASPPIFCRDSAPTLNSFRASRAAIKLAIIWRCWATVWIFSPPAIPTN